MAASDISPIASPALKTVRGLAHHASGGGHVARQVLLSTIKAMDVATEVGICHVGPSILIETRSALQPFFCTIEDEAFVDCI